MRNMSPLGVLLSIVIIGITVEVVEGQSKSAAYALVVLILLGIITFNSVAFTQQVSAIVAVANGQTGKKKDTGGSAKFS